MDDHTKNIPERDESFLDPDNEERPADEPALADEGEKNEQPPGEEPNVPPGGGLSPTTPG
jgi:hypothetical protein